MKKVLVILSGLTFFLISCSDNDSIPVNNNKPPDYTNSYYPMGKGIKYKYEQGSIIINYEIRGTIQMRGKEYFHWQTDYSGHSIFYRASGDSIFENGLWDGKGRQVSEDDILMLIQSAQVGQKWRDTIIRDDNLISYFEYEVIERGISRKVEGKNYIDVIHVTDIQKVAFKSEPGNIIGSFSSEKYFAKGVGLIELDFGFGIKRVLLEYSF